MSTSTVPRAARARSLGAKDETNGIAVATAATPLAAAVVITGRGPDLRQMEKLVQWEFVDQGGLMRWRHRPHGLFRRHEHAGVTSVPSLHDAAPLRGLGMAA
jgi:hypothetical protein